MFLFTAYMTYGSSLQDVDWNLLNVTMGWLKHYIMVSCGWLKHCIMVSCGWNTALWWVVVEPLHYGKLRLVETLHYGELWLKHCIIVSCGWSTALWLVVFVISRTIIYLFSIF